MRQHATAAMAGCLRSTSQSLDKPHEVLSSLETVFASASLEELKTCPEKALADRSGEMWSSGTISIASQKKRLRRLQLRQAVANCWSIAGRPLPPTGLSKS